MIRRKQGTDNVKTLSLQTTTALSPLDAALAAMDPILDKVHKSIEAQTSLHVDLGRAFGASIRPQHNEPLDHPTFTAKYADAIAAHYKARIGYLTGQAHNVIVRVANLSAAGKTIPTRAAIQKKNGKVKPVSDSDYLVALVEAQQKAGLAVSKAGSGGARRGAVAEAAKAETGKANPATPEAQVSPVVQAAAAKVEAAKTATDAAKAPSATPATPETKAPSAADVKKAREDAAAMIMGNAKLGDLLLRTVTSRKAALIAWMETPPAK